MYRVLRSNARMTGDREFLIARGIETLAEAAALALRLYRLQTDELGGQDEFWAEVD